MEWFPFFVEHPRGQPRSTSPLWHFSVIIFSSRSQNILDPASNQVLLKILAHATHRCPASIRTLNGPLWGPGAIWGPIISPRSITPVTDLGLLGAAIYRAVLKIDQQSKRSHPNKAVEVVVCQTF